MAGPWEKYAQPDTSGPWAKYAAPQAEPMAPQPEQPGMGVRALQWVGRQVDRLGPAEVRGAAQAFQAGQPSQAFSMALQGAREPNSVQSFDQMAAGFGADTTPRERTLFIPPASGPGPAARVQTNTSPAEDWGQALGLVTPTVLDVLPGAKAAAKAVPGIAKTSGKIARGAAEGIMGNAGVRAAERSILEKYSFVRLRKMAATMGDGKEIQTVEQAEKAIDNAPQMVAQKLREHDLLHNPAKANFNLQRDLRDIGGKIGETVQDMKARDVTVDADAVLKNYIASKSKALRESGKGVGSASDFDEKVAPKLAEMVSRIGGSRAPIDKVVTLRRELQDMVKNWGDAPGGPLIQRSAKELQYRLNQVIASSDKMGPKLAALNGKYSELEELRPLIEDAYTRGFGRSAGSRDVRPLPYTKEGIVNRLAEAVGSPYKSLMNARPQWADALANKFNQPRGLNIPEAAPTVTPAELEAIRQPFISVPESPLPPRTPGRRPLLEREPTYVPRQPSVLDEGLPPRRIGNASPGRRPLSPIAPDPSLSVEELGKVMDKDAAKEIAANQYQADRLKVLWKKVQEAKTPKQRTALMNLIRAVHKSSK